MTRLPRALLAEVALQLITDDADMVQGGDGFTNAYEDVLSESTCLGRGLLAGAIGGSSWPRR